MLFYLMINKHNKVLGEENKTKEIAMIKKIKCKLDKVCDSELWKQPDPSKSMKVINWITTILTAELMLDSP